MTLCAQKKQTEARALYNKKIAKTNSSVNLSTSLPSSDPQINQLILGPPQRAFLLLCVFFFSSELPGSRLGKRPCASSSSFPPPQRTALFGTVCQSGKKRSLFCLFCSYHHPTLPLPENFHSPPKKTRLQIWLFLCFIRLRDLADGVLAFDFWFILSPSQLQMEPCSWQQLHEYYPFH